MNIQELKSLVRSFENSVNECQPLVSSAAVQNALTFLEHLELRGISPSSIDISEGIRFNFALKDIDVVFMSSGDICEKIIKDGICANLEVSSWQLGKLSERLAK